MESIWTGSRPRISEKKKELPKQAEVVIIGGGMAGLLCAYLLEHAGIKSVLLEARGICSGQTERTTAKITSQHGLIYDQLSNTFDERTAGLYGRLNQRAIDEYERIIKLRNISCDFVRLPSYLYTETEGGMRLLEKERTAAKRAGIQASIVYETDLPFQVKGALKYENQAQFHPLKFLAGIVDELEIFEYTTVIRAEGNYVVSDKGTIQAEHIVFATHFPFINVPGYYFARMHQERSYVLALKRPVDKRGNVTELRGMYYGIDKKGLSFRQEGDTILFGGSSHRTGIVPREDPFVSLRKRAEEFWSDYEETFAWSAQDCMTLDHLPYVGQFSKKTPEWYVATGFGKWGMTGSMLAAMTIRDALMGYERPDWEILSPQRKLTTEAMKSFGKEIRHTTANFVTFKRPRCPHLGCRLVWNPYEKTWDCPCHGSRLREDGTVIDNPAQGSDCDEVLRG